MRHAMLWAGCWLVLLTAQAGQPYPPTPPKPGPGFFQKMTPTFSVESNISQQYTDKLAQMVMRAEQRFYQLFKLTPDLINGVSKAKFDNKYNIPGDIMAQIGYRPYVTLRVHKNFESYADEFFELTDVKDPKQRLTVGLPGAYIIFHQDYDKKTWLRDIRSYVASRDEDELERTLLHEMGHLFMKSYLLDLGLVMGGPPAPDADRNRIGTPAWLSEGTAQLFELLWSNAKSAEKERNRQHVMIYEALNAGDSYPFDKFIDVTNAHNLAAVAGDPLKATINYAQSFSVMDYFVNVDGQRFMGYLEVMRALNVERNLRTTKRGHIQELFSFQNEAFKKVYTVEIKEAEQHWRKHVKKSVDEKLKKQPELYAYIGEFYLRRGKDKEADMVKAEENFAKAMKQAPTKGDGYIGTGRMMIRRGNNEEAEKVLTKASELMPKDSEAWYFLGVAQVNTGKLTEAIGSFEKSLKIYSRHDRALAGLATAALHSKNHKKAIDAYEQAYQITHHPRYLIEKGRASFFGRDYRNAQAAFNSFTTVYPNDAQGQFWYGLAALRLGDKAFALEKMKLAATLNPNDAQIGQAIKMTEAGQMIRFELESEEAVATAPDKAVEAKPAEGEAAAAPPGRKGKPVEIVDDE